MSVATQPEISPPPTRGWLGRNWKWFIPGVIALAVATAAIAALGYVQVRSYRYRQNPAYQLALAEVQQSKQVQDHLGQPIVDSDWNPQGSYERDGEVVRGARFNFTVSGPKGSADVAVAANVIGGEWAANSLRVSIPDREPINLTRQVLSKQKIDTPQFDLEAERQRKAKEQEKSQEAPPPELNVEVPQLPPGLK